MDNNKKITLCAYCGHREGSTKDHVPPRALFIKPYPENMIAVPACEECHNEMSLQDEYFLMAIGFVLSGDEKKHAKYLTDKVKRALKRPEAKKLRADLINRTQDIEVHSVGGIYLGNAKGTKFDWPRLKFFAQRILKALYFEEYKKTLETSYQLNVFLSWFQKDSNIINSPEIKEILQFLARSKARVVGDNVFQYWFSKVEDDCDSSFWYVRIAQEFGFFGIILPKQELTNQ